MSAELFTMEPVLSPRLRWMREHRVNTHYCECADDGQYWAWVGERDWTQVFLGSRPDEYFVQADTAEEALVALAVKLNIPTWHGA